MREELEKKLIEKYPKIFRQCGSTPQESCMAFGIETGDGWYWLIDNLCEEIQGIIDNHNSWEKDESKYLPQLEAAQVKEKYGSLRIYHDYNYDNVKNFDEKKEADQSHARFFNEIDGAIAFSESLSYKICEDCGTLENVKVRQDGWIRTLCDNCENQRKKGNKNLANSKINFFDTLLGPELTEEEISQIEKDNKHKEGDGH